MTQETGPLERSLTRLLSVFCSIKHLGVFLPFTPRRGRDVGPAHGKVLPQQFVGAIKVLVSGINATAKLETNPKHLQSLKVICDVIAGAWG